MEEKARVRRTTIMYLYHIIMLGRE